jgi:hypothetical protein
MMALMISEREAMPIQRRLATQVAAQLAVSSFYIRRKTGELC